jgi:riboflavin kinase/FMN adenylyltransferase
LIRIARSVPETEGFGPSALTIGNFDGVHIGHQHLLEQVCDAAKKLGVIPSVLTFDPHPASVVAPDRAPRLLTDVDQRCTLLAKFGIEQVFVLPFTMELARLSPEEFVRDIVAAAMRANLVVVGDNFRFGHKQAGNDTVLAELGARYGFETCIAEPVTCRGRVVSSSDVRKFMDAGEVGKAWRFLNRPYSISGDVVHGRGVGAKQTVPTLNLQTTAAVLPRNGVYVTRTRECDGKRRWHSITNIGIRPTFAEAAPALSIETFLLTALNGETPRKIEIEFLHHIREERRFENPEALKAQIMHDVNRANAFFRHWKATMA